MSMLTVRQLDPADKDWLHLEAQRQRISMEELVRRIIHEQRLRAKESHRPSQIVLGLFGPEAGIDLSGRPKFSYKPRDFPE